MRILARFKGPNGEIRVLEEASTGARHYQEGGVSQSCVLAGGEADVAYVSLMATLLENSANALLFGCGGGALGDHAASSREPAGLSSSMPTRSAFNWRVFFWMPNGIECVTPIMRNFVCTESAPSMPSVDVGGPCFSYEAVLQPATIARVRDALRDGGRIAVNISCEVPDDPVPGRIADRFKGEGLEVWAFTENAASSELNVVILASACREAPSALAEIAGESWSLAQLTGGRRSHRRRQMAAEGR
jgi:hypothetical protein